MTEQTAAPTPTEHSTLLGGSIAERRVHCPGSYALEKDLPHNEDTEHTLRGTALHAAIAWYLTECDPSDPIDVCKGKTFEGRTISQKDLNDALIPAVTQLDALISALGGEVSMWVEQRVQFSPDTFGTIDIVLVADDGRLIVLDWKFGFHEVPAEDNQQLAFYAAALVRSPDDTGVNLASPLTLVVVQPEVPPGISKWEAPTDYLNERTAAFESAIRTAQNTAEIVERDGPDAAHDQGVFVLGDHCQWCRAKTECPAQLGQFDELSKAAKLTDLDPYSKSLQGIDDLLSMAPRVEKFIAAIREKAAELIKTGDPGAPQEWKLIARKGNRAWTDADAVEEIMKSRFKIAEMYNLKLVSPTQAERMCAKIKPRVWKQKLEPMIERKDLEPALVSVSHKAPAMEFPVSLPELPSAMGGNGVVTEEDGDDTNATTAYNRNSVQTS